MANSFGKVRIKKDVHTSKIVKKVSYKLYSELVITSAYTYMYVWTLHIYDKRDFKGAFILRETKILVFDLKSVNK